MSKLTDIIKKTLRTAAIPALSGLSMFYTADAGAKYGAVSGNVEFQSGGTINMTLHEDGRLQVKGGYISGVLKPSTNTTLGVESSILVDTSSADVTLTLPNALTYDGQVYNIKKKTSDDNEVKIVPSGNELIDLGDKIFMDSKVKNLPSISLISSDNQWYIMSKTPGSHLEVASGNLVAWWKFDETTGTTLKDYSGNGYDGTFFGGTFSGCTITGKIGNAVAFDGVDDYIDLGDVTDTGLNSGLTLCAWVRRDTANYAAILVKYAGAGLRSYRFNLVTNTAPDMVVSEDGTATNRSLGQETLELQKWNFITGVWNSGQNSKLYINGKEISISPSGTTINTIKDSTQPLEMGRETGFYDKFDMDEARIYDKALTPNEIKTLYNQIK